MSSFEYPHEPTMSDLLTFQNEFTGLESGVRSIKERYYQIALFAEERIRRLQSKVEELEAQNLAREVEIQRLEEENAELYRKLELWKPVSANIVKARDSVLKELDSARKVIEVLLNERVIVSQIPANMTHDSARSSAGQHVPIPAPNHPKPTNVVEFDDDSTVRLQHKRATVEVESAPSPGTPDRIDPAETTRDAVTPGSPEETAAPRRSSVPSEEDSVSTSAVQSNKDKKRLSWYLEFEKRPATAEVGHGPIPIKHLTEQLHLDETTVVDIESLESTPGYDTRICSGEGCAFVYRPVILEGTSGTYLIGWGDEIMVRNVRNWIKRAEKQHMFFYPAMENAGWFYLGLHTLSYTSLESLWHKLPKEDKARLLSELQNRNHGMDIGQFKRDVKDGRLKQCCIQIESQGNKVESHDFLRIHNLLDGEAKLA